MQVCNLRRSSLHHSFKEVKAVPRSVSTTDFCRRLSTRMFLSILVLLALTCSFARPALAAPSEDKPQDEATFEFEVPASEKDFMDILLKVKDLLTQVYPSEVGTKEMYEGMLRGLLESLGDPHSGYMTKDEYEKFMSTVESTYTGVGVVIQLIDGQVTIMNVIKDSPAQKAGVMPGDIIVGVDGIEYSDLNDVAAALRGPEGTGVILEVFRSSTGETLHFVLSRARITASAVEAQDLGDGIFYIDLDHFDLGVFLTFGDEIARVKELGARGLILDLRDNPGGLLDAGVVVAESLVPKGPIVELKGKIGHEVIASFSDLEPIPVAVLVNERTASASEIVAGAIRDHGVGILLGKNTYGKGSIQQVLPLGGELGAIRLTIAEYYTPSGTAISGKGLAPDIEIDDETTVPSKLEYTRVLRRGSVGLDVLALQETLSFLGYAPGQPDGIFGPRTEQAVRSFLAAKGRSYAGYVGSAEVQLLNQAVVEKVKDAPDIVRDRAVEVLKHRLQTGEWPVGSGASVETAS